MPFPELERLVARRLLTRHVPSRDEIENHVRLARDLLASARLRGVPERVRFTNLYEAAHSVALAGLKLAGYRAPDGEGNRSVTLGMAERTLALRRGTAATFLDAHRKRSLLLYEGSDVDIAPSLVEMLEAGVLEAIAEIVQRSKRMP